MNAERLAELTEAYLAGELTEVEAVELVAAVEADEQVAMRFADDVRWGHGIEAVLRRPTDAALAARVEQLITAKRGGASRRTAEVVINRIAGRRWWRRTAVAAAALACAALIVVAVRGGDGLLPPQAPASAPAGLATLVDVGEDTVLRRGSETRRAAAGMALFTGDALSTVASGARLGYSDATGIELAPATTVTLGDAQGGKRLTLDAGAITATVAPQPPGRPLRVVTPHAEVRVVGTRFTLASGAEETRLEVVEGAVRLTPSAGGDGSEVGAGMVAIADRRGALMVATAGAMPPLPAAAVASLVGRWTFEDEDPATARDWSGGGHNGVLAGTPGRAPGRHGRALACDGVDDDLRVPSLSGAAFPTTGTLALWLNIVHYDPDLRDNPMILDGWGNHDHLLICLETHAEEVVVRFCAATEDGKGSGIGGWNPAVPPGEWHHLAVTWDAATQSAACYVDGRPLGSLRWLNTDGWAPRGQNLCFGGTGGEWQHAAVLLDDIVLCDRVLASEDIAALAR